MEKEAKRINVAIRQFSREFKLGMVPPIGMVASELVDPLEFQSLNSAIDVRLEVMLVPAMLGRLRHLK